MLAGVFDRLGLQLWQAAGSKNTPRPKPFPRPGAAQDGPLRTSLSPQQIKARLVDLKNRAARGG